MHISCIYIYIHIERDIDIERECPRSGPALKETRKYI